MSSQRKGLKLGVVGGKMSRSRSTDKKVVNMKFGGKGGSFGTATIESMTKFSRSESGRSPATSHRAMGPRSASRPVTGSETTSHRAMGPRPVSRPASGADSLPRKHLRRPPVDRHQKYRTKTGGTFTKDTISANYEETLAREQTKAVKGLHQRRMMAQNKGPCAPIKKLFSCCNKFSTIHALNDVSRVVFEALLMEQKDFRSFAEAFDRIDINLSGSIDFTEYFEEIGEYRSPFSDYLFTLIDDPSSDIIKLPHEEIQDQLTAEGADLMMAERVRGVLNFNDFVQTAVIYCMYTREDILQFAFRAFDTDGSGFIEEDEFRALCAAVNNLNPTYPGNFTVAMGEVDSNNDGVIDFEEFKVLNERFPLVLFPAFRLQDRLQASTLGRSRWVHINEVVLEHSRLERYRTMHAGMLPPRTFAQKLKTCFYDPRWARHKFIKPEPQSKKKRSVRVAAGAGASSRASSTRSPKFTSPHRSLNTPK